MVTFTPKIAIVNGNVDMLIELGDLLSGQHYDVEFADSEGLAYTQIKHDQPDLVILCGSADDLAAFDVWAMLSIDEKTCHIPVMMYLTRPQPPDADRDVSCRATAPSSPARWPLRMN
jgi:DNA-binding response OmpR family regulator